MFETENKHSMFEAEIDEFSLVLRDRDNVIFSSKKHGLRPLLECVVEWSGRVNNASLTDKVVGRAAARLIVRSGIIGKVTAGVISRGALQHLSDYSIPVKWIEKTDVILRGDGKGICPMEELSNRLPDDRDYFPALFQYFSMNTPDWLTLVK